VGGHDRRTAHLRHALHDRGVPFQMDVRTEALQLVRVHERFSNTVSVTTPVPSATQLSAVNCACMSVGNAGYGAVLILTAFGRRPPMSSSIQSSPQEICAPASSSLDSTASSVLARACRARTL